jgi:hypothetical protein
MTTVVLGWRYTNTPISEKGQVSTVLASEAMGLSAASVALRTGDGDR